MKTNVLIGVLLIIATTTSARVLFKRQAVEGEVTGSDVNSQAQSVLSSLDARLQDLHSKAKIAVENLKKEGHSILAFALEAQIKYAEIVYSMTKTVLDTASQSSLVNAALSRFEDALAKAENLLNHYTTPQQRLSIGVGLDVFKREVSGSDVANQALSALESLDARWQDLHSKAKIAVENLKKEGHSILAFALEAQIKYFEVVYNLSRKVLETASQSSVVNSVLSRVEDAMAKVESLYNHYTTPQQRLSLGVGVQVFKRSSGQGIDEENVDLVDDDSEAESVSEETETDNGTVESSEDKGKVNAEATQLLSELEKVREDFKSYAEEYNKQGDNEMADYFTQQGAWMEELRARVQESIDKESAQDTAKMVEYLKSALEAMRDIAYSFRPESQ